LLAVQEVRWLGRSTREKKGCRIYVSCDDNTFLEQALLLVNAGDQEKLILSLLIEEHVCLELEVNLKIRASSVPMLQCRKRVKERRMNL